MVVPSSAYQLAVLVLLVVPGICYAAVRRRLKGPMPEDREFSVRLMRAIVLSVFLDAVYLVVAGPAIVRLATRRRADGTTGFLATPRQSAMLALVLLVGVPTLLALLAHLRYVPRVERASRWRVLGLEPINHPTPSAWDLAAPRRGGCFVRILTADNHWVGGWLGDGAFISTYPEPRDILIEVEWNMSPTGAFLSPVRDSLGLYVPLSGSERVAWIAAPE